MYEPFLRADLSGYNVLLLLGLLGFSCLVIQSLFKGPVQHSEILGEDAAGVPDIVGVIALGGFAVGLVSLLLT